MITRRVWDKSWCCEGQGPAVPSSWSVWWIRDWTLNKQNLLVTHNWARLGRAVGHWSGGGLQINNDTITATVWDISDYTQDVSRSMIFMWREVFCCCDTLTDARHNLCLSSQRSSYHPQPALGTSSRVFVLASQLVTLHLIQIISKCYRKKSDSVMLL